MRLTSGSRLGPYEVTALTTRSATGSMVVRVTTRPGLTFSAPTALPIEGTMHPLLQRNFDVTPDGRQVLAVLPAATEGDARPRIEVVQNWFEELKRLVPPN